MGLRSKESNQALLSYPRSLFHHKNPAIPSSFTLSPQNPLLSHPLSLFHQKHLCYPILFHSLTTKTSAIPSSFNFSPNAFMLLVTYVINLMVNCFFNAFKHSFSFHHLEKQEKTCRSCPCAKYLWDEDLSGMKTAFVFIHIWNIRMDLYGR